MRASQPLLSTLAEAPLLPIVNREKQFLLALSLSQERYCNQARGYFYSGSSQFHKTKAAFDSFFIKNPQVKRVAFIVFDDPEWGNSYREIWEEIALARKVEVIDTLFKEKFQRRFNRYPILEAYSGYEAMRSVVFALKRQRKAPHEAMRDVVYQGVAGPIDYSGTSCAGNQSDWGLFQIRGGIPIEQP